MRNDLPETIETVEQLDEVLSRPTPEAVELFRRLEGDLVILGAAGKVGPSLVRMADRAAEAAGWPGRIHAVSRSLTDGQFGPRVHCRRGDLLDPDAVAALPDADNVLYLPGRKFGSTGAEHLTWAANCILPALAARRYAGARVVMFSTGCVYPIVDAAGGGATEETPLEPVGEYAMSCLGRERVFDYYARTAGLRVLHFRLNYAVELRYGVLVDIAARVLAGQPIDLTTSHMNLLWQGDVCDRALRCLELAASPAAALNVTGPETLAVRDLADAFSNRLGREPRLIGEESGTGFLSNAARSVERFGPPTVPVPRLIDWTADWLRRGMPTLEKPTHFEARDGVF